MAQRAGRPFARRTFLIRTGLLGLAALAPIPALAQEAKPGAVFQPGAPTDAPPPSSPPRTVEVSPEEVVRGDPSKPNITLAINVGAGSEPAVSMLDTLRDKNLRTTFFVLGWWADRQQDILRRI